MRLRRIRGNNSYHASIESGLGTGFPSYMSGGRFPRKRTIFGGIGILIVLLFVVTPITYVVALKASEKTTIITVEDKESVTVSSGSGDSLQVSNEYRVYTDKGVYKVTDSLIYGTFRAADRYAKLKIGHTYECKQAGWRIGLFSSFPNLIECREVS